MKLDVIFSPAGLAPALRRLQAAVSTRFPEPAWPDGAKDPTEESA